MDAQQQVELQRLETQRRTAEINLDQAQQRLRTIADNFRSGAESDVRRYKDDIKRIDDQVHRLMRENK